MSATTQETLEREHWTGPTRHYDIIKEGVIATFVVLVLTVVLAAVFSSPDDPAETFKTWAANAPDDLYATTVMELAGTSVSAGYGPPYNTGGDGVALGPLTPQKWAGVHEPVDPTNDFVITPLSSQQQPAEVAAALETWKSATADAQTAWATAYDTALNAPDGAAGDATKVPTGDYGPVPALATGLVAMANAGALDGVISASGDFYTTNNTKQILFFGDGTYFDTLGSDRHVKGNQWGMMNEPANYPGQQWLAPFAFWYQLPAFNSEAATGISATLTANADIYIMAIIAVLVLLIIFVPFIPGLRSIPRWVPLHRLIWRDYYRNRRT